MDIDRLKYFVVLSNSSSMREAAEHLHISQPALSKAMKLLEYELQEKLFVASGRRILITDKGELIASKAQRILDDLSQITKEESSKTNQDINIGTFEVFSTYFLKTLFKYLPSELNITMHELVPGKLEEKILKKEVDFGITYAPIPNAKLEFIKVTDIEMGVFGKAKNFKNIEFENLPFVIPVTPIEGSPHKVKGLDGWPDDKISRTIKYRVELMQSAIELCRQSLAVAYLPKFVVHLHNEQVKSSYCLQELEMPKKLRVKKQGVYIIKRKTDIETTAFRNIAKALRVLK